MDWVRAHYERVVLLAAAVFLLMCAFFIWRATSNFGADVSLVRGGPQKNAAPPGRALEVEQAIDRLRQPAQWTFSGRSGLFVPEKHFIAANGFPATLQTTELHPPVPNEWFEQFNLPITDADALEQDSDGDGFNNLEEWQGHTNPTDRNSHPEFFAKLKLRAFSQEPFRFMFSSRAADTFGINTLDLQQPTQFVKVGDVIAGTHFKVTNFVEKTAPDKYGTDVDVSELTLQNVESGEQLTLVKEKVAVSPESVAIFVYTWGERKELTVKKDQEFSLPPQTDIRYKLVDVQPNKAVIVSSQKPDAPIEIGLLSQ